MKTKLLARLLSATGTRIMLSRVVRWSGVICFNYHRIGRAAGSPFEHGLWNADEVGFDAQVRFLKSHFDVVTPDDLPGILARKRGRHVLITFDDGYLDNYTAAFPILKRHNVKATFFLTTGFLDKPRLPWWDEIAWMVRTSSRAHADVRPWIAEPVTINASDREPAVRTLLRAYKTMPAESTRDYLAAVAIATGTGRFNAADATKLWMTWDMVREMRAAGMVIGGHTVNHPILARMPRDRQWEEIDGCGRRLADELKEPMTSFSYPVGGTTTFTQETRDCLKTAGVRWAFSYYGGYRRFGDWDDYDIRRVAIESYMTPEWFRSIVSLPRFFA